MCRGNSALGTSPLNFTTELCQVARFLCDTHTPCCLIHVFAYERAV